MNNRNVVILIWFWVIAAIIVGRDYWFALEPLWQAVSLSAVLVISFFLLVNYNLRSFGSALVKKDETNSGLGVQEQLTVAQILKQERNFRFKMALFGIFGLIYIGCIVLAAPRIDNLAELFVYLTGWAVFCFIVDTQIRLHLMCNLVKKIVNQSEVDI